MIGHVLDSRVPGQFKGVAFKGMRVVPPRFGEIDRHLPRAVTIVAFNSGNLEQHMRAPVANRQAAEQARFPAMANDSRRTTGGTTQDAPFLLDGEHYFPLEVICAHITVATNAEPMVK